MTHTINIESGDDGLFKGNPDSEPGPDSETMPPVTEQEDEKARLQKEVEDIKTLLQMREAEFRNFRKRTFRERDETRQRARHDALSALFPVLDNLERALTHRPPTGDCAIDSFVRGVEMTYVELLRILESFDVYPIKETGVPFDPALHEAVATVSADKEPDCTVVEILQAGYRFGDHALRPARVVIAKASGSTPEQCACELGGEAAKEDNQ